MKKLAKAWQALIVFFLYAFANPQQISGKQVKYTEKYRLKNAVTKTVDSPCLIKKLRNAFENQ